MKRLIMTAVALAAAFVAGCDKLPTVERMTAISTVIGKTAGYACELSKTKAEVKAAIFEVLDVASKVVPGLEQTFTEAWTPVIAEELGKLVEKGTIKEAEASIAKVALSAATEGIDYVFVKYPDAKEVKELVSAATAGVIAGYKSVVTLSGSAQPEIDEEAYKYLRAKLLAAK